MYLKKLDFDSIAINYFVFINDIIIIIIYIDDILLIRSNKKKIAGLKEKLFIKFKIINLGGYVYYLNIIVIRDQVN